MKSKQRVAIYNRANQEKNAAVSLYQLETYDNERGLDHITFTDVRNSLGQALEELLQLVRRNKVDIIITHSLSRFSRKPSELTAILSELEKYNVQVVTLN